MGVSLPPHNILSPFHLDSTTAAVTRGGLIVGVGATPKWTLLTIGAANSVLVSDGTDTTWSATPTVTRLTVAEPVGSSALTLTGATQTTSFPVLTSTQTWNAGAVAFTGWLLNVTNTASLAASKLMDLQVGGTTVFGVSRTGVLTFTGTTGAASTMFSNSSGVFIAPNGGGHGVFMANDAINADKLVLDFLNADVALTRDAAGIAAFKNGTSAQTVRVYGTTTGTKYSLLKHDGTDGTVDVSSGKLILGGTASDIQWGKALVTLGTTTLITLGKTGGSGPVTAAQDSWLQLKDSAGNTCWVPVWK